MQDYKQKKSHRGNKIGGGRTNMSLPKEISRKEHQTFIDIVEKKHLRIL